MFSREFMIRTDNGTLKETPYILNGIGMDGDYMPKYLKANKKGVSPLTARLPVISS